MTFINWISVSVPVLILAVGIGLKLYYRKRLNDLDGFMGIETAEPEDEDDY